MRYESTTDQMKKRTSIKIVCRMMEAAGLVNYCCCRELHIHNSKADQKSSQKPEEKSEYQSSGSNSSPPRNVCCGCFGNRDEKDGHYISQPNQAVQEQLWHLQEQEDVAWTGGSPLVILEPPPNIQWFEEQQGISTDRVLGSEMHVVYKDHESQKLCLFSFENPLFLLQNPWWVKESSGHSHALVHLKERFRPGMQLQHFVAVADWEWMSKAYERVLQGHYLSFVALARRPVLVNMMPIVHRNHSAPWGAMLVATPHFRYGFDFECLQAPEFQRMETVTGTRAATATMTHRRRHAPVQVSSEQLHTQRQALHEPHDNSRHRHLRRDRDRQPKHIDSPRPVGPVSAYTVMQHCSSYVSPGHTPRTSLSGGSSSTSSHDEPAHVQTPPTLTTLLSTCETDLRHRGSSLQLPATAVDHLTNTSSGVDTPESFLRHLNGGNMQTSGLWPADHDANSVTLSNLPATPTSTSMLSWHQDVVSQEEQLMGMRERLQQRQQSLQ